MPNKPQKRYLQSRYRDLSHMEQNLSRRSPGQEPELLHIVFKHSRRRRVTEDTTVTRKLLRMNMAGTQQTIWTFEEPGWSTSLQAACCTSLYAKLAHSSAAQRSPSVVACGGGAGQLKLTASMCNSAAVAVRQLRWFCCSCSQQGWQTGSQVRSVSEPGLTNYSRQVCVGFFFFPTLFLWRIYVSGQVPNLWNYPESMTSSHLHYSLCFIVCVCVFFLLIFFIKISIYIYKQNFNTW